MPMKIKIKMDFNTGLNGMGCSGVYLGSAH